MVSGLAGFVRHCYAMARAAGTDKTVETDQGPVLVPAEDGPLWERLGREAATRLSE